MDFRFEEGQLIISVDAEEQRTLKERIKDEEFPDSDEFMTEVFEPLIANSEWQWVDPATTGDLTSAPMLGVWGPEVPVTAEQTDPGGGYVLATSDRTSGEVKLTGHKIIERYAFMDYALRSPVSDLAEKGEVTFVGGRLD